MNKIIVGDKEYHTVEEMFEDMEKEFKEKHPFSYWIDNTMFKNKSFFDYAPHHFLSHPWIALEHWWLEIKWAWQRVFRGWDDRVVWSIDCYLDEKIPEWLERLKKIKHGVPGNFIEFYEDGSVDDDKIAIAKDLYNKMLDRIINGFKAHKEMNDLSWSDPRQKELKEKFKIGFALLEEYYETLWD